MILFTVLYTSVYLCVTRVVHMTHNSKDLTHIYSAYLQNVLIQMGLPVVSVDGMLIRRAKTFVLRCHACYKVTNEMDKQFCPSCGNGSTLVKISASVDRYGQTHYHTMRTRKTNLRGTKVCRHDSLTHRILSNGSSCIISLLS